MIIANSRLCFTVLAVLSVHLSANFAAIGQNKIVYLSEPGLSHFELEYNAIDQCMKSGMHQSRINSFSLKFKLRGKCANGLLLCYPGALDSRGTNYIFGMMPNNQFRVDNLPGNDVAMKCAEKQQEECKRGQKGDKLLCHRGNVWHGIRLSKPIGAHNEFLLEMSITNKTYPFVPGREFSIIFGNKLNLETKLLDQNGEEKFEDEHIELLGGEDHAIRDAFLARKAQKLVRLVDYVGLWMVGLDFLPMHIRDTMHIHVSRDCGCELHAWFLRPNESPKSTVITQLEMVPPIPANCPISVDPDHLVVKNADKSEDDVNPQQQQQQNGIQNAKVSGKMLRVAFRVNKNPRNVSVRFADKQKKHIMAMIIVGKSLLASSEQMSQSVFSLQSEEKNKTYLMSKRERYVHLDLLMYAFFYEFKMDGVRLGRFFPWPADWWTRANQTEDISSVGFLGDLYPDSAETHLMDDFDPRISVHFDHLNVLQPMGVGDRVFFQGQVNKDSKTLAFFAVHNGHKVDSYIGTVLLVIQFNFTADGRSNVYGAYYQSWDEEFQMNELKPFKGYEKPKIGNFLQKGAPFEIEFAMFDNSDDNETYHLMTPNPLINVTLYTILDGVKVAKHFDIFKTEVELPINNFGAEGDLDMFREPEIIRPNSIKNNAILFFLQCLLAVGDSAIFEGKLDEKATELRIYFLHNTVEPLPNDSNIPLAIIFKFHSEHSKNFMHLQFNATEKLDKNKRGQSFESVFHSRLFAAEEFKIEIKVMFSEYRIFIHGAFVASFEHRFPPWAVTCFRLDGELSKMSQLSHIQGKSVVIKPRMELGSRTTMPIIYKIPNEKEMASGSFLTIRSETAKPNNTEIEIELTLLFQSLETYQMVSLSVQQADLLRVGKVVLHAEMTKNAIVLYQRTNSVEMIKIHTEFIKVPIEADQPFNLDIRFGEKEQFVMLLNGIKLLNASTKLPQWAIEYVRLGGDLKPEKTAISSVGKNKKRFS